MNNTSKLYSNICSDDLDQSLTEVEKDLSSSGPSTEWYLENIDIENSYPQSLEQEINRLQVLISYNILGAEREPSFERITGLATRIFNVPIALVSLIDFGRQWFMSNRGLGEVRETPRRLAFCAHAILSRLDLLIIPDATQDPRFQANALVTGSPNIRFYAGAPLICPEGFKLGTLCIIDTKTRPQGLTLTEKHDLRELACLVVETMVSRREKMRANLQDRAIACVAHDLLTPLTGIQLNLGLLTEDDELKLESQQREILGSALGCTEIMVKICQQAMETYRTGEGKSSQLKYQGGSLGLQREENVNHSNDDHFGNESIHRLEGLKGDDCIVDVSEVIRHLMHVMQYYPKKVPFTIDVSDDVPNKILSYDVTIFRSALNLLTNAAKHTNVGSIHLQLSVRKASTPHERDKLVFECKDTGSGVPLHRRGHLFTPFVVKEENVCRLGLGLYSIATSVSKIGGEYGYRDASVLDEQPDEAVPSEIDGLTDNDDFDFEAALSQLKERVSGSTFWFSVPFSLPMKNRISNKRSQDQESDNSCIPGQSSSRTSSNNGEKQISTEEIKSALIIDDSLTIRKTLGTAFEKCGFRVSLACDGMEGLKMLKIGLFDLVLCDFLMPVMDGFDCVAQFREWEKNHRPGIKQLIIGISAHASSKDTDHGISVGMDRFVPKPISYKLIKDLSESTERMEMTSSIIQYSQGLGPQNLLGSHVFFCNQDDLELNVDSSPVCLIAEDSDVVTKVLVRFLAKMGWRCYATNNGVDALHMLKKRNWDLVLLDCTMPMLTGSECVSKFRDWEKGFRANRQSNIYMISGNYAPGLNNLFPDGFDGALGKPIKLNELKQLLNITSASRGKQCILSR